jgi:hypothetical protein
MGAAAAGHSGTPGPDAHWLKSSLSFSNGNCVEAARLADGHIGVRHSQHPQGPVLRFSSAEWRAFLAGARNGEFDRLTEE